MRILLLSRPLRAVPFECVTKTNRPRSVSQYSNVTPSLSGQASLFSGTLPIIRQLGLGKS